MSAKATRLLMLAQLLFAFACAEDKADDGLDKSPSPTTSTDAGATADAGASAGDAGAKSDGALSFAAFDQAIDTFIASYNASEAGAAAPIKGASAIVVDKQSLLHSKGYGEFAADRLYLIASSSKILSVGVLMRLQDQKKLDITAPISTYLAEWGDTAAGKVTVQQLVSNSSGLPSLAEVAGGMFLGDVCQYSDVGTLSECGKKLYATPPPRGPDMQFAYGGSQWQLAGAVAEVVSGKSWAELIKETYVEPCDVPSLGYTNQFGKSQGTSYPTFFEGKKETLPVTQNPSIEGGAYVTAPDYAKLLQMHLNGGTCGDKRVLSEQAVKTMQQDRVASYGGTTGNPVLSGYGMGWWTTAQGFVADPGAYGAFPWIDNERGYAAMVIIEVTSTVGAQLVLTAAKPALDATFDARK